MAEPLNTTTTDDRYKGTPFERVNLNALAESALNPAAPTAFEVLPVVNNAPQSHGIVETLGANLRINNMVGNWIANRENNALRSAIDETPDPDFNPTQFAAPEHEQYLPYTAIARNRAEYDALLFSAQKQLADRQILEENPGKAFLTGFLANALDPTILLPGGTIYKTAQMEWNLAKSAISVGVAAASASGIQEAVLWSNQDTRTARESVFNVVTSGIIGSFIGGLVGPAFGGGLGRLAKSELAGVLDEGIGPPKPWNASRVGAARGLSPQELINESASAAATDKDLIRQSGSLAGNFLSKLAVGGSGYNIPMMRMLKDGWTTTKMFVGATTENNFIFNRNLPVKMESILKPSKEAKPTGALNEANPVAVETLINIDKGMTENALIEYHDIFLKSHGIDSKFLAPERVALLNKTGLNRAQFGRQVYDEIINPGQAASPFVKQAAELINNKVFEPVKNAFIEEGIFPPDVSPTTAMRYFMRVYNRDLIKSAAGGNRLKLIINDWVIEKNLELKELMPQIEPLQKELRIAKKDKDAQTIARVEAELETIVPRNSPLRDSKGKIRRVLQEHEYETVAENTIDNILGRGEDSLTNPILSRLTGSKPSPLASRVFLIPDEKIADFLLTDPIDVVPMFANATIPYLHMIRFAKALEQAFPNKKLKPLKKGEESAPIEYETPFTIEDGFLNLKRQLKEELDQRKMETGANEKQAHKLEVQYEEALRDIADTYDMLMGRYGMGSNVLDGNAAKLAKTLNNWNFTRFMGFLGLSALPDLGSIVLKHGVFRYLADGLIPIMKNLQGNRYTKTFLQDMGLAINTYKGMLTKGGMGRDGLLTDSGIFSKSVNYLSTRYGNATLANQWQDFNQFVSGRISLSRTLRAIDKYVTTGKMGEKERLRLNQLGISEAHYKTIHNEFKRIGGIEDGAYWINFTHWSDASPELTSALSAFRASIYKDVNSTVLQAGGGIGDIPKFTRTPLGSMMFQFKKYFFQATNRILIPALQKGDAEAWQGAAMMITLGGLGWFLKGQIKGNDMDLSYNNVAINAIDQSGLAGIYGVYYGVASGFGLGIEPTRYNNVGQLGNIAGPLSGSLGNIASFINKARDPERTLTTKDYEKWVQLLPAQNYPPIDRAGKSLGRSIGRALGAEESE